MKTTRTTIAAIAAAVMMVFALQSSFTGVNAQATPSAGEDSVAHPAHIHAGACPDVTEVVFPLNDLTPPMEMSTSAEATSMASPSAMMGMDNNVAAESTTDVDATLDDILAADHAINIHESADNMSLYIACGNITGTPTDGELHIQIEELNGSGLSGEAHLVDNGDGTTTVTVTLMASDSATPEASPTT